MALFLITYDLKAPGRNYDRLHQLLGTTWQGKRIAESVWLAELKGPAPAVRDLVQSMTDANDRLVVIELGRSFDWAATRALAAGVGMLKKYSP